MDELSEAVPDGEWVRFSVMREMAGVTCGIRAVRVNVRRKGNSMRQLRILMSFFHEGGSRELPLDRQFNAQSLK
jgi:hypothetical protein